ASAFTLTNRATRLNQTAVERTTVSNLMRQQVEVIRGARSQGDSAVWQEIKDRSSSSNPSFAACEPSSGSSPFWLDPAKTFDDDTMVNSYVHLPNETDADPSDIYGIWAETYFDSPLNPDYVDVY